MTAISSKIRRSGTARQIQLAETLPYITLNEWRKDSILPYDGTILFKTRASYLSPAQIDAEAPNI